MTTAATTHLDSRSVEIAICFGRRLRDGRHHEGAAR